MHYNNDDEKKNGDDLNTPLAPQTPVANSATQSTPHFWIFDAVSPSYWVGKWNEKTPKGMEQHKEAARRIQEERIQAQAAQAARESRFQCSTKKLAITAAIVGVSTGLGLLVYYLAFSKEKINVNLEASAYQEMTEEDESSYNAHINSYGAMFSTTGKMVQRGINMAVNALLSPEEDASNNLRGRI